MVRGGPEEGGGASRAIARAQPPPPGVLDSIVNSSCTDAVLSDGPILLAQHKLASWEKYWVPLGSPSRPQEVQWLVPFIVEARGQALDGAPMGARRGVSDRTQ
eukprot:1748503-Pyramimonas_sp.AAC.1